MAILERFMGQEYLLDQMLSDLYPKLKFFKTQVTSILHINSRSKRKKGRKTLGRFRKKISAVKVNAKPVWHLMNLMGFNKSAVFTGGWKKKKKLFPCFIPNTKNFWKPQGKADLFWVNALQRRKLWSQNLLMNPTDSDEQACRKCSSLFWLNTDSAIN